MKDFNKLVKELDVVLKKFNPINYNKLQVPIEQKTLKILLNNIFVNDEDIFNLFCWRNGIDESQSPVTIFKSQSRMLPIQEIVQLYEEKLFEEFTGMPNMIPLFLGFDTDWFLYNNNAGANHGKIHLYSVPLLSIDNPAPYYDSMSSMLQTNIVCYEEKAIFLNGKTNEIEEDIDAIVEIYKRINPISNFYNREDW